MICFLILVEIKAQNPFLGIKNPDLDFARKTATSLKGTQYHVITIFPPFFTFLPCTAGLLFSTRGRCCFTFVHKVSIYFDILKRSVVFTTPF